MTDTIAASNTSAAPSSHTANDNDNYRAPSGQPTTPSTPRFDWTSAKDGVLVALMAAKSSCTSLPRWVEFAMACKSSGVALPYHLSDDELLNRCHELKSRLEEWDLFVDAQKREESGWRYGDFSRWGRNLYGTKVVRGSQSAVEPEETTNGTGEQATKEDGEAAAASCEGSPQTNGTRQPQSSFTHKKEQKKQRESLTKKIEAKKRARKRQSNIVIQGNFDFFNVKQTRRGSKKKVSFRGEGTVNVPF